MLEANELLKACFPEILYTDPAKESPRWSLDDNLLDEILNLVAMQIGAHLPRLRHLLGEVLMSCQPVKRRPQRRHAQIIAELCKREVANRDPGADLAGELRCVGRPAGRLLRRPVTRRRLSFLAHVVGYPLIVPVYPSADCKARLTRWSISPRAKTTPLKAVFPSSLPSSTCDSTTMQAYSPSQKTFVAQVTMSSWSFQLSRSRAPSGTSDMTRSRFSSTLPGVCLVISCYRYCPSLPRAAGHVSPGGNLPDLGLPNPTLRI